MVSVFTYVFGGSCGALLSKVPKGTFIGDFRPMMQAWHAGAALNTSSISTVMLTMFSFSEFTVPTNSRTGSQNHSVLCFVSSANVGFAVVA